MRTLTKPLVCIAALLNLFLFVNCTSDFSKSASAVSSGLGGRAISSTARSVSVNGHSAYGGQACPTDFVFANGYCYPTKEGQNFGTVFGIMYSTWHCPQVFANTLDVAKIMSGQQAWGTSGSWFWKSEPLDGYYCLSSRDDVLRKHAIELRDAGIKFVYIDASNHQSANGSYADRPAAMILEPLDAMLRVWSEIPGAPRIVPFAPVTSAPEPIVDAMMNRIGRYPQMYLMKEGKPFFLLTTNPDPSLALSSGHLAELANVYSYRKMWHHAAGGFEPGSWSFSSFCADPTTFKNSQATARCAQLVSVNSGTPDHISVSPAINSFRFSLESERTGRFGGRTFAKQFATIFENPSVRNATISDWNSWVAIGFSSANGSLDFVDTYTDELSRDMEPTRSQGDTYYRLMKACIAKFARGEPCNEGSLNEVPSVPLDSSLGSATARACSYPSSTNLPGVQTGQIYGYVDGLTTSGSRVMLGGWACIVGSNQPLELAIYLGGPAGAGTLKMGTTTTLQAESAVHSVCQNAGSVPNRFSIDVTDWMKDNPGASLFVHGVNPQNGLNYYIANSGMCAVPWPENLQSADPVTTIPVPPPPPVAASACKIALNSCPNHPELANRTLDDDGSSAGACFARGNDYSAYCAATDSVTANFFISGISVMTQITPPSQCNVTLKSCPNHPDLGYRTFIDDDHHAGSIPAVCQSRANDYSSYCATTEPVTTDYYKFGSLQVSHTTPASECMVTLKSCPNHTDLAYRTFNDDANGAGSNPAVCQARANDYSAYCATTEAVTTDYFKFGTRQVSQTTPASECKVTLKSCPNQPQYAYRTFNDDANGAGSNAVVCQSRANDYSSWCATTEPVTTDYFKSGSLQVSRTTPSSECTVTLKSCPNHPDLAYRTFNDDANGAGSNPAVCQARANDYSFYCATTESVTADYFKFGTRQVSQTTPASECKVTLKSCPNQPWYAYRTFNDDVNGAGSNAAVCQSRANDYSSWCATTEPVTTDYFKFGTWQVSQTTPASECKVTLKSCPNHPDLAYRTFNDDDNHAGSNASVCQSRANDFSFWCATTEPVTTDYYKSGTLQVSQTTPASECKVTVRSCPNQPQLAYRTFNDDSNHAGSNSSVCQSRASEYTAWCITSEPVFTQFFRNGFGQ